MSLVLNIASTLCVLMFVTLEIANLGQADLMGTASRFDWRRIVILEMGGVILMGVWRG